MESSVPKISIIIPVYNTADYLSECLESILNQTFQDFEVLILNDGSTDNSMQICKKYRLTDKRIIVVDKLNSGVSDTRNLGLKLAKGEYIFFCDSDDYLLSDCLSILINYAENSSADMISAGYTVFDDITRDIIDVRVFPETRFFSPVEALNSYGIAGNPCVFIFPKLIKRKIIDECNLSFDVHLKYLEDVLFSIQFIKKSQLIITINKSVYFYRQHSSSTMAKSIRSVSAIKNMSIATELIYHIAEDYPSSQFYFVAAFRFFRQKIGEYMVCFFTKAYKKDCKAIRKEIKQLYKIQDKKRLTLRDRIKFNLIDKIPLHIVLRLFMFGYKHNII